MLSVAAGERRQSQRFQHRRQHQERPRGFEILNELTGPPPTLQQTKADTTFRRWLKGTSLRVQVTVRCMHSTWITTIFLPNRALIPSVAARTGWCRGRLIVTWYILAVGLRFECRDHRGVASEDGTCVVPDCGQCRQQYTARNMA